jgi:hypothetical protein
MAVANTLAYCIKATVMAVKSFFLVQALQNVSDKGKKKLYSIDTRKLGHHYFEPEVNNFQGRTLLRTFSVFRTFFDLSESVKNFGRPRISSVPKHFSNFVLGRRGVQKVRQSRSFFDRKLVLCVEAPPFLIGVHRLEVVVVIVVVAVVVVVIVVVVYRVDDVGDGVDRDEEEGQQSEGGYSSWSRSWTFLKVDKENISI